MQHALSAFAAAAEAEGLGDAAAAEGLGDAAAPETSFTDASRGAVLHWAKANPRLIANACRSSGVIRRSLAATSTTRQLI